MNTPITSNWPQPISRPHDGQVRILVIPGLRDSDSGHWQSWLQTQYRGAVRVKQRDWYQPSLTEWSSRIAETISKHSPYTQWIAVAHSFGCLALAHHLGNSGQPSSATEQGGIKAALLVAPADPEKFGVTNDLPTNGLGLPATVIGSENDPWMPLNRAQTWANHWSARFHNQGQAGHINTESGYGAWPWVRYKVDQMIRDQQRQRRLDRAHPLELHYAV